MKSVATAYAERQALAKSLLQRLGVAFDVHAAAAAAKPHHWGFMGDVDAAAGRLIEALGVLDALTPEERARYRI